MLISGGMGLGDDCSPVEWLVQFLNGFTVENIEDLTNEGAADELFIESGSGGYSGEFPLIPGADPDSVQVRFGGDNFAFTNEGSVSGTGTITSISIVADVNGAPVFRLFQFNQPVSLADILAATTNSGRSGKSKQDMLNLVQLLVPSGSVMIDNGTDEDDLTKGHNGDDDLFGNDGKDTLIGMGGDDSMLGNKGNDLLKGGAGSDTLGGNGGKDKLIGGGEADTANGGGGNDKVLGGGGGDRLSGGKGQDTLQGGSGADLIFGDGGDDFLRGNNGSDDLFGGAGNDTLFGGSGNDLLLGGAGNDLLDGGAGSDEFLFGVAGRDTIQGFNAAEDFISISGVTALVDLEFSQIGSNVLVRFNDIEVIVNNVTVAEIQTDDVFGF